MAEQAEAIVPWLSRYQTAMWRVRRDMLHCCCELATVGNVVRY